MSRSGPRHWGNGSYSDYDDDDEELDEEEWTSVYSADPSYILEEPDPILFPELFSSEDDEEDESSGASDYYDSRPWGPNNDGY
jgi:hypothetical protein